MPVIEPHRAREPEDAPLVPEPEVGAPDVDPRRGLAVALQQSAGNQMAQGALAGARLARAPDPEAVARAAFLAKGMTPSADGQDVKFTDTGIGGFNARWDPAKEELLVRLRVGIDYKDALTIDGAGLVTGATADFATTATGVTAKFPDQAARAAEVAANWQWSADKRTDWATRYRTLIENGWGHQHHFTAKRWSDVHADVRVELDVHDGHRDTDHCKATVFKTPDGSQAGPGAVVDATATGKGYGGTFTSAHMAPTVDFLNFFVEFRTDSADLSSARCSKGENASGDTASSFLDKFLVDYQPGTPGGGPPVTITGRASAKGDAKRNTRLAAQRGEAVAAYLRSHGAKIAADRLTVRSSGAEGASEDKAFQRTEIMVGDGRPQITMLHETGHMFGLRDEYASPPGGIAPGAGTPGAIGTPTGHDTMAKAMGPGASGSVFENNDNIMSVGNSIRPQHYSTFLNALNQVVAPESFVYGDVGAVPKPIPDLIGPDVPGGVPDTVVV